MQNFKLKNYGADVVASRAASLIYALVIITVMMIVAGTMSASFLRSSQRNYDLFRGEQAYYIARAAMEDAFHYAHQNGVGYEDYSCFGAEYPSGHAMEWDTNNDSVMDAYADWEVFSRAKGVDWQDEVVDSKCATFNGGIVPCYLVPIPGTGDAGDSCDFTTPSDGDGDDINWNADEDDKCNWNKIAHGETISVPLFTEDNANPFTGSEEFILRLRTPNGEVLTPSLTTDIIASWEFKGECATGTCYLRPDLLGTIKNYILHTNLNISKTSYDFIIIKASDSLGLYSIIKGTTQNNEEKSIKDFLKDAENVYFKLIVTGTLNEDISGNTIPYLEYQIITHTPNIISDNKITYTADGYAIGRLGTYARHIWATQKLGSDPIINFALQN